MTPRPDKLPRYWPWIFWALLLAVFTCLAAYSLRNTPLRFLHEVIDQRGLATPLILWIGFATFGATLRALRQRDTRHRFAQFLLFISGLPLVIGGLATYDCLASGCAAWAAIVASATTAAESAQAEQFRFIYTRIAWDTTKLAVLIAIPCFALAVHLWLRNSNNNQTPGTIP